MISHVRRRSREKEKRLAASERRLVKQEERMAVRGPQK
jgi:hypothetical protein